MPGSQTNVPAGHPLARKLYSVAVFAESRRRHSFTNSMTAPAPKMSKADRKMRGQTSPDFPIVLVTDLQKGAGETVSVDLFHNLRGLPVMGDQRVTGKAEGMTSSSMDVSIDFGRKPVDTGGRMARKRTVHNLREVGKANLVDWYRRYEDQCTLVHLAGSRGSHNDADWILPLDSDPEFNDYLINPVIAPTFDRHFYANDATSLSNLDTSDHLSLDDIDRLRVAIDESPFPLQPIRLPEDPAGDEEPLYVLMVTPRQWHHLQTQTGSESWRTFLSNAYQRASGWNHPLFKGSPGMWNGILVKKMYRPIRFNAPTGFRSVYRPTTNSTRITGNPTPTIRRR